jgi:hypothetical protein
VEAGDREALDKFLPQGVAAYNRNIKGTGYDDGNSVVYDKDSGNIHFLNSKTGELRAVPLAQMPPEQRERLLDHAFRAALANVSLKTFEKVRGMNKEDQVLFLEGVKARVAERQAATGEMNARTMSDYRRDANQLGRDRLGLERAEFNARRDGGMYTRQDPGAGLGQMVGMSDDGTKALFVNPRGGISEQPLPAGYSKLFPKTTGREGKGAMSPENDREYRKGLAGLGARPKDPRAAADWDAEKAHLDNVFGVQRAPSPLESVLFSGSGPDPFARRPAAPREASPDQPSGLSLRSNNAPGAYAQFSRDNFLSQGVDAARGGLANMFTQFGSPTWGMSRENIDPNRQY